MGAFDRAAVFAMKRSAHPLRQDGSLNLEAVLPSLDQRETAIKDDFVYVSVCSGGQIIKINAAELSDFIFGQGIVLTAAIVLSILFFGVHVAFSWITP